jgi:hypothetical protein
MRQGLLAVFILILTSSCIDQKDYSINSVTVNPSETVPLAFGNLSIQDMLNSTDSLYVHVAPDSLVYVEYTNELISNDIRNLFTLPNSIVNQSINVPPGSIPSHPKDRRSDSLVEVVDLGLTPEQLSEIDFKAGTISYSSSLISTNPNIPYYVVLSSTDFTSKTTGGPLSITTSGSGTLPMSDYKVALNKNKFNLKLVFVLKANNATVTIPPNTSAAVSFGMSGMNFNLIEGFLGDQTAHPPAATLEIGAFGDVLNKATVSFAQPSLSISVVNGCGVPVKLDFIQFEARKKGSTLPILLSPPSPVTIGYPTVVGNTATTPIAAANAKQVIDFAPTSILYQMNAHINEGLVTGNNFVADTSTLHVNLNVNIPLYGHATNILLRDTAQIDFGNLDQSEIQKASLKIDATNQLPLDAIIQLYLTDDKYIVIDSLFEYQTEFAKASTVTSSGTLLQAGVLNTTVVLDPDKLTKIFTAKNMIIKGVFNTSKNASGTYPDVKFKSNYTLVINVILQTDLNLSFKL